MKCSKFSFFRSVYLHSISLLHNAYHILPILHTIFEPRYSIIKADKAVPHCFDMTNTVWQNQVPMIFLMYGLHQLSYKFYMLLCKLMIHNGLMQCEVDHVVFMVNDLPLPMIQSQCLLMVVISSSWYQFMLMMGCLSQIPFLSTTGLRLNYPKI